MNAFERFWMPVAGLTASAVIVAAVVAIPKGNATEDLLTAAERTAEVHSVRMAMTSEFAMDLSFGELSLGEVPPPPGTSPDGEDVAQLLEEGLNLSFSIDTQGAMVLPDRMQMDGTVTTRSDVELPDAGSVGFGFVAIGDEAWISVLDMGWIAMPVDQDPFGPLVIEPEELTGSFLREPVGDVEDLGIEDLDGERVRHLRFEIEAPTLDDDAQVPGVEVTAEGLWSSDAWIGVDDDLLRRLDFSSQGSFAPEDGQATPMFGDMEGSWTLTMSMRLSDFDADIAIEPPPADQVRELTDAEADAFGFLAPFGGGAPLGSE